MSNNKIRQIDFATEQIEIDRELSKIIPDKLITDFKVILVRRDGKKLQVWMTDPKNQFAIDDLKLVTGCDIEVTGKITKEDFQQYRESFQGSPATLTAKTESEIWGNENDCETAPIIQRVNEIFQTASKEGATHIDFIPTEHQVWVYLRKGRTEIARLEHPKFVHAPFISRLKIMSGANIAERRLPQTGVYKLRIKQVSSRAIFRFCPVVHGEMCQVELRQVDTLKVSNHGISKDEEAAIIGNLSEMSTGVIVCWSPYGYDTVDLVRMVAEMAASSGKTVHLLEQAFTFTGRSSEGVVSTWVNQKVGMTLDSLFRSALELDFGVTAVDSINRRIATEAFTTYDRLIIVGATAPNETALKSIFVQDFEIPEHLYDSRVLAWFGLEDNKISVRYAQPK